MTHYTFLLSNLLFGFILIQPLVKLECKEYPIKNLAMIRLIFQATRIWLHIFFMKCMWPSDQFHITFLHLYSLVLQQLKVNSRIITILGIAFSMIGLTILADWQSIPYDMCTDYSLFHHPELAMNYSTHSLPVELVLLQSTGCQTLHVDNPHYLSSQASVRKYSYILSVRPELATCQVAHSCAHRTDRNHSLSTANWPHCMFFTVSSQEVCLRELNMTASSKQHGSCISCMGNRFQTCTHITDSTARAAAHEIDLEMFREHILPSVHAQALQIVNSAIIWTGHE